MSTDFVPLKWESFDISKCQDCLKIPEQRGYLVRRLAIIDARY